MNRSSVIQGEMTFGLGGLVVNSVASRPCNTPLSHRTRVPVLTGKGGEEKKRWYERV